MLNEIRDAVHENAVAKGFYEGDKNFGELLMLVVSELGECLEAHRAGKPMSADPALLRELCEYSTWDNTVAERFRGNVKDLPADEIADAIIRLLDICGHYGIDIDAHVYAKMKYNETRERKHGKAY